MSSEPSLILILIGLGLDEFSMPPSSIPEVKYIIRSMSLKEAQHIAQQALKLSTGKEVEEFSQLKLREILR